MIRSAVGTVVFVTLISLLAAPAPQHPPVADGRVATVVDRQGTAVVQPAGRQRWTPLLQKGLLLPGDTVRTETRGANAIELELAAGGTMVVGPGSKLELVDAATLHLLYGEVELLPAKTPLRATGPGGFDQTLAETAVLRASERKTEVLRQPPRWLTGYRASTTDEYLGSLLAKVDGRDVPLHLGYHKVDVTIKDQLCETTIEESFVNSTGATLEGVFRFPLPADAAIAGFGMWIGNELVEADVVERQRARQIYEEILRRKQDPGLLEWAGGNIFQANVYPIPPHGEKRVRIRYTQVLAKEGSLLRYRYALRSELTRSHPLRDLQIRVEVQSSAPIGAVASPTHELQLRQGERTASATFSAQEYTPLRDFELQIPLQRTAPVVTATHVADGEGWFLAWLSLPGDDVGWQRATTPETAPLDLVIMADTSGSMGPADREAQTQFVAALLQMLSPKDRFRLMTCDVSARWFRPDAVPVDAQNRDAALDFLLQRSSLGWTDLDAAFAAVAEHSQPGTTVVYVGDGIPTAGDADAAAFAQRLLPLRQKGRFHAVATGSSYDTLVLQAVAALGGSLRSVGDDAAAAAFALLDEAAQPAMRDVRVRFDRITTAAVYPATLPNLARGRQQILVGRYDPNTEIDKPPSMTVTGVVDGKEQSFTTLIDMHPDDGGNSFVPRLWARAHVEALLLQGGSKATQDSIVAASQRYGIITPYTSLLVLENEADRQEFGVARTVKQSDGEAFFAKARDAARTEALQQAMAQAKSWRLMLRQQALRQIKALGGDLYGWHVAYGGVGGLRKQGPLGAPDSSAFDSTVWDMYLGLKKANADVLERKLGEAPAAVESIEGGEAEEQLAQEQGNFEDFDAEVDTRKEEEYAGKPMGRAGARSLGGAYRGPGDSYPAGKRRGLVAFDDDGLQRGPGFGFPYLAPAAAAKPGHPDPEWPAEVQDLLRRLDRRELLQRLATPLQLTSIDTRVDDGSQLLQQDVRELLWHAGTWVRRLHQQGGDNLEYVRDGQRGVLLATTGLARRRAAEPSDQEFPDFALPGMASQDLLSDYRHWTATVQARSDQSVTVRLASPDAATSIELDVDPVRHVLQQRRDLYHGNLRQRWRFAGFVEVAGAFWATTSSSEDMVEGRTGDTRRLTIATPDAAAFAATVAQWLQPMQRAIVLPAELPELDAAREAAHRGAADLAARFCLLQHAAERGQWPQALTQWQELRKLLPTEAGAAWIEARLLTMARRGEAAPAAILRLGAAIAADATGLAAVRAELLLDELGGNLAAARQLQLLTQLDAVVQKDDDLLRRYRWQLRRLRALDAAGETDSALAAVSDLVQQMPAAPEPRREQARLLESHGQRPAAIAVLQRAVQSPWPATARGQLFRQLTDSLWAERDLAGLRSATERWITADGPVRAPNDSTAWLRWLSVQLLAGEVDKADAWVEALANARLDPDADPVQQAQLQAALQFTLGNGWGFYKYDLGDGETARTMLLVQRLVQLDHGGFELARAALDNWRFQRTDDCRRLRQALAEALLQPGAVAAMPLGRLTGSLAAVDWSERTDAEKQTLAAALRQRWQQNADPGDRNALAGRILQLLGSDLDAALAFQREQLRLCRAVDRAARARGLFDRLVDAPWTADRQRELLALLPLLPDPWQPTAAQVREVAGGVRKAADAQLAARQQALLGDPAQLRLQPRAAQRAARAAAKKTALDELAAAFAAAEAGAEGALAELLATETICLRVRAAAGDSLPALNAVATAASRHATSLRKDREAPLHAAERERCRLALAYAACSSKADAALIDGALAFYAGEAKDAEDTAIARSAIVRLLLALDRQEQLRSTLLAWIAPTRVDRDFRALLGLLQAETGDLAAAEATFVRLEQEGELAPSEYAALADWRLVLGDGEARARAQQARFDAMSTDELWRFCYEEKNRIERRGEGVPDDLDPLVVQALQTLLAKSERPDNQLWLVRELYQSTKDHRVLQALADGVPGHDSSAIFEFLKDAQGLLLQVHEEAALQALRERIAALQAGRDGELDRRGLQWLAVLASLRAAEVPGVAAARAAELHLAFVTAADAPVTALDAEGIAALLASIRKFPGDAGQRACLRLLDRCVAAYPAGSTRQLGCALHRAEVQWQLGQREQAARGLLPVLADQRQANGGRLPERAQSALVKAQGYHLELGRYTDWEHELVDEIDRHAAGDMRTALQRLRFALFAHCLEHGGSCSFGRGRALYDNARTELERAIPAAPAAEVPNLVGLLCSLCRAADHAKASPAPGADLFAFASGPLQQQLPRLFRLHADMLQNVAGTLAKIDSPLAALRLLVQRARTEPKWLARLGDDGWRQFHYDMSEYRQNSRDLGDVEPALRQLVLQALDHQLRIQNDTGSEFWDRDNRRFWSQLAAAYLEVAQQVLATTKDQPAVQTYVARYLWSDLHRRADAIDALQAVDQRSQLNLEWRWQLVRWLHEEKRFADSLRHLEVLIGAHPDTLDYRTAMVQALHQTRDDPRALELLLASEQRLRAREPAPRPEALAQLGQCGVDCGFAEPAVRMLTDAIRGREQQVALTRNGDGERARWYASLSQAHSRLGAAAAAVDAAGAAVVCAGRDDEARGRATRAMAEAVHSIADLDAYVQRRDAETDASGLDSPVVRKALGAEYLDRSLFDQSLRQYQLARQLQANDRETRQRIALVFDKMGKPRQACAELEQALVDNPADAALTLELAERLQKLGDEAAAERARTQLVEPPTGDGAGHRALAELRDRQQQPQAAAVQWRHVVRLRSFEPDGWLGLAGAAAAAGDVATARQALQKVIDGDWPERFRDVKQKAKARLAAIGDG